MNIYVEGHRGWRSDRCSAAFVQGTGRADGRRRNESGGDRGGNRWKADGVTQNNAARQGADWLLRQSFLFLSICVWIQYGKYMVAEIDGNRQL